MNTEPLNSTVVDERFQKWIAELEKRHLAELTFSEASRALRALSSAYVERRHALRAGAALSGTGKRAAFALFYAPLHFLLVRHIYRQLAARASDRVIDLGCGTGAAGAAVGTQHTIGIDRNQWAVHEAAATYRTFGLRASTRQVDVTAFSFPDRAATVVAAFAMNELPDSARELMLERLMDRVRLRGDQLLVVEPIARGAARWWDGWGERFARAGGRADQWRVRAELPAIVAKLDRAAGLNHRELTGRSLWLAKS